MPDRVFEKPVFLAFHPFKDAESDQCEHDH